MTDLARVKAGMHGAAALEVTEAHTAIAMGSGTLEVFSTPVMIALMEAAAVDCVEPHLPEGTTSLGIHLDVSHRAATPIGARVTATAVLTLVEGRTLSFAVEARDATEIIGSGTHTRVVVDRARFETKLARKQS